MCMGIPGRVVRLAGGDLAEVEIGSVPRMINTGLLPDPPAAGVWVLVHSGFALSIMDEYEVRQALEFLVGIDEAYQRAMTAPSDEPVPLPGT